MSHSTIFEIDKDYKKLNEIDFQNSWLFSPIVMDELFWKYFSSEGKYYMVDGKIKKQGFISSSSLNNQLADRLNEAMNNCSNMNDRILWELVNQQVFEKKDFNLISEAIQYGIKQYLKGHGYGKHIIERWNDISVAIFTSKADFIVFKNTSCDDQVEEWFVKFDEETDEYIDIPIYESDDADYIYFVVIDNNRMEWETVKKKIGLTT